MYEHMGEDGQLYMNTFRLSQDVDRVTCGNETPYISVCGSHFFDDTQCLFFFSKIWIFVVSLWKTCWNNLHYINHLRIDY